MALPGCYAVIELGDADSSPDGPDINLAGLNFAVVMAEEAAPVTERFSTWGMAVESSTLYQSLDNTNQIIVGHRGKIYVLSDDAHNDDGTPIAVMIQTGPLPEPTEDESANMLKRLHEVYWQVGSAPPVSGYTVRLTITDVDKPTNRVVRIFQQYTREVRVPVGLVARQWTMRIRIITDRDYNPLGFGMNYQLLHRPYTGETI